MAAAVPDDLAFLDGVAQADLLRCGAASPIELVDAAIDRIERLDPGLNAVIHERFERARAEATAADSPLPDGPLRGVPTLIKDLDGTLAGEPLHQGNRLLKALGHTADHDSYLVARIKAAGAVIVGKTNTPEFGLLPTTEPVAYGPTRNPWNPAHSPGGSSGGSGVAVAAGMVPFAHAGDGGGSIRIPASHCGCFGLKPSRGRVSLGPDRGEIWAGAVARHVVTRSVRDSACVLDAIAGAIPGDPYTAPPPARSYTSEVGADPGRMRIGIRTAAPGGMATVDPACAGAAEDAGRLLESLGHVVEPVVVPALDRPGLVEAFTTVLVAGVVADLDRLAEVAGRALGPDDVEPLTWHQYEMGRATTAREYVAAIDHAHRWTREVVAWWQDGYDLLLTPTCAEPPPLLGDVHATSQRPLRALERAIPFVAFTAPFNVTGQPAASVPLAWSEKGLPIGVQLVADQYREDVLFRVCAQIEAAHPWADRRPPGT